MKKIDEYIKDPSSNSEYGMASFIERYAVDNYEEIEKENAIVARYMNDDLIDICEKTEPGLEGTEFRDELEEAYHKIKELL